MRPSALVLLSCLAFSIPASAQPASDATVQFVAARAAETTHANPDDVVARLMSFDRDGDGKIAKEELFERMEGVLAAGDRSGDGVLDEAEIRGVAERPRTPLAVRGFQAGRYAVAAESEQSLRRRVEGALADLKLASPAKEDAAAIVQAFLDGAQDAANADLFREMAAVLTPEQLTRFQSMQGRLASIPTPLGSTNAQFQLGLILMALGRDGAPMLLAPQNQATAQKAFERFTKRQHLDDSDRTALLDDLKQVLTDEQRDDLRAALERSTVVKTGGGIVGGGVRAF